MKALLPPLLHPQPPLVPLYVYLYTSSCVVELGDLPGAQLGEGAEQVVLVGPVLLLIEPSPYHALRLAGVTVGRRGHAQILPFGGALSPAALGHALCQPSSPPSTVAFGDELVPTPTQPVEVLIGAEAPV